jgi:hypothetical protein
MFTKSDKQSGSSIKVDLDSYRVLGQVLSDPTVASALDGLVASVKNWQLERVSGKLDAMARPNTSKHFASSLISTLISLVVGFGAGVYFHDESWPVMAWVTHLFA